MNDSRNSKGAYRHCARCGSFVLGSSRFCTRCGARLEQSGVEVGRKDKSRVPVVAIIASVVVILLLAGAVTAGIVLFRRQPSVEMPRTEAELESSVARARGYLNDDGKELAEGRAKDATIYSVSMELDDRNHYLSGEEYVLFTNTTPDDLGEVVFRMYSNSPAIRGQGPVSTVTEARADDRATRAELNGSLLKLPLPQTLQPGDSVTISFNFKEHIPRVSGGIGLEDIVGNTSGGYGIFGHSDNVYDLGYPMPIVASYRDGQWENRAAPSMGDVVDFECSYFNVAVDVPSSYVVAGTGELIGDEKGGGRRVYSFAAGPARDFSIQASPDYEVTSKDVANTTVYSYYLESSSETGKKVLEYGTNAVKHYSRHFGPYPYNRLNICEAPLSGGAAGMEFTGQILLAQMLYGDLGLSGLDEDISGGLEDLLGDEDLGQLLENVTGGIMGETLEFVTAHEVGHMWWGLGVGSDSIGHPWQDESLTNYTAVQYFRWQHGEEAERRVLDSQIMLPYSAAGMLGGDMVVDTPVDDFPSSDQYVAIVYSKGALFFKALEEQIGSEAYDQSLQSYYRQYVFENAVPEDLVQAFEANVEDPQAVASLYQRWIKEKHADEDIAASPLPGMDIFEDLIDPEKMEEFWKDLEEGGLDLGPLEDMMEELFDGDSSAPELPSDEPEKAI